MAMLLSDASIKEAMARQWYYHLHNPHVKPLIDPEPEDDCIQPASVDLKLLANVALDPNQFKIASTLEVVSIPLYLAGRIEGKSTIARDGLLIHAAGWIDPGFSGQLTLELKNLSDKTIQLKQGMKIGQIAFFMLDRPAERGYGSEGLNSHYQDQRGATPARH
jgi:dCTP deaminase